jgi:hypothetical protein
MDMLAVFLHRIAQRRLDNQTKQREGAINVVPTKAHLRYGATNAHDADHDTRS